MQGGQIQAGQNLIDPVFYRSPFISDVEILKTVEQHADGRLNWMVGAEESKNKRILPRLYERAHRAVVGASHFVISVPSALRRGKPPDLSVPIELIRSL